MRVKHGRCSSGKGSPNSADTAKDTSTASQSKSPKGKGIKAPVIGSGSKQCRMLGEQSQEAEEQDVEASEGIASRRKSGKLRSRLPTLRGHGGKGEQRSKASQHSDGPSEIKDMNHSQGPSSGHVPANDESGRIQAKLNASTLTEEMAVSAWDGEVDINDIVSRPRSQSDAHTSGRSLLDKGSTLDVGAHTGPAFQKPRAMSIPSETRLSSFAHEDVFTEVWTPPPSSTGSSCSSLTDLVESVEWGASADDRGKAEGAQEGGGTRVRRTLSFLRSRMGSSRNWDKMKNKEKEMEEKDRGTSSGHLFVEANIGFPNHCSYCNRAMKEEDCFECQCCSVKVHKGCRDGLPVCSRAKLRNRRGQFRSGSTKDLLQATSRYGLSRNRPQSTHLGGDGLRYPLNLSSSRSRLCPSSLTKSVSTIQLNVGISGGERNGLHRSRWQSTESLSFFSRIKGTSMESLTDEGEDVIECNLMGSLEAEARCFEADSWSVAVDPNFVQTQNKDEIKRQDVIYELMQTEMHHIRTLRIMSEVFARGMRKELQWNNDFLERIFPCLDDLLELHTQFISRLLERRRESLVADSDRNFVVLRFGDILMGQFSGENGRLMKETYGTFCSQHCNAVAFYKEMLARERKFQNFIRRQSSKPLVRRLGVQECILLVTQRITKYPVIIERIIKSTKEGTTEHSEISEALSLVRGVIGAVDEHVSENSKRQRIIEIYNRMEGKAMARVRPGTTFSRADMLAKQLVHDGPLRIRTPAGRLREILAVLFTDTLVLLLEKDQKYSFASLEPKPPVIPIQKLMVREIANEEKGLFLISNSSHCPEMYEVHTNKKKERQSWATILRTAVESCPDIDEGVPIETEEDKKLIDAKMEKAKEFQERLASRDTIVRVTLEEKLQIYAEMADYFSSDIPSGQFPTVRGPLRLNDCELKAEALLLKALQEAEKLQQQLATALSVCSRYESPTSASALPKRAETFGGFDSNLKRHDASKEDGQAGGGPGGQQQELRRTESDGVIKKSGHQHRGSSGPFIGFFHSPLDIEAMRNSMFSLTQTLYSIQSVAIQQDSMLKIARLGGFMEPTAPCNRDPGGETPRPAQLVTRSDTVRERIPRQQWRQILGLSAMGKQSPTLPGLVDASPVQDQAAACVRKDGILENQERRRSFHVRQNSLPIGDSFLAEGQAVQPRRGSVDISCLGQITLGCRPGIQLDLSGQPQWESDPPQSPTEVVPRPLDVDVKHLSLTPSRSAEDYEDDSDESKTPTNMPASPPPCSPDVINNSHISAHTLQEQLLALKDQGGLPSNVVETMCILEVESGQATESCRAHEDDNDEIYF
uniref:rho guanine nucleotide exchange factor 2-like isoform X3 n=1 Tax=Myxine glutinosa TaxID=7769 RepID=UPI00358EFE55